MVQILNGELIREDMTKAAMGGTEIIAAEMVKRINPELLQGMQIIHSRVRDLDFSKKRILVIHDLPGDPEFDHLKSGGYNVFDALVFVSNWQMQRFIDFYGIPWYKCKVIKNAINPLERRTREPGKVRLVYHTTPHRGLEILLASFEGLLKALPDIDLTLDVFSSFKIYGWEERDNIYQHLFDFCKNHDKINYHGTVSNEEVKKALTKADIFAYPSIWPETSSICLIEALSAGLLCVHPNFAALYETAGNWTVMYQYQDNIKDHANKFTEYLLSAIRVMSEENETLQAKLNLQSDITNMFYNWDLRTLEWEFFLNEVKTK